MVVLDDDDDDNDGIGVFVFNFDFEDNDFSCRRRCDSNDKDDDGRVRTARSSFAMHAAEGGNAARPPLWHHPP